MGVGGWKWVMRVNEAKNEVEEEEEEKKERERC